MSASVTNCPTSTPFDTVGSDAIADVHNRNKRTAHDGTRFSFRHTCKLAVCYCRALGKRLPGLYISGIALNTLCK